MRKTVSVRELREYCEENQPSRIIFYSENQKRYRLSNPCKLMLSFPQILVGDNTNVVCLKEGKNTVRFDEVRYAEINTDYNFIGTLLTLFCGESERRGKYTTYTLIAE